MLADFKKSWVSVFGHHIQTFGISQVQTPVGMQAVSPGLGGLLDPTRKCYINMYIYMLVATLSFSCICKILITK